MDSKNTLTNKLSIFQGLPVFGIIFVLIACAAFYLCRAQNEQAWLAIYSYYSEHLLDQEKLIYQDFYYKRLAIEHKGEEPQLAIIKRAISQQDHQTLSHIILSDRSFRTYLAQKAPIYFSNSQKAQWSDHNKTLNTYLHSLSEYQFAIIPELFSTSPAIANLFTHIFIDTQLINFLSNIFIFLLLSTVIERFIKRALFLKLIIASSISFSSVYLVTANSFSPPLMALNGTIYLMGFIILSLFLKNHYQKGCLRSKLCLLIGLLILSSKLILDYYSEILNHDFLIALTVIGIFSLGTSWFYPQLFYPQTRTSNSKTIESEYLPKHMRHRYSEALLGLSRFNFDYSRKLLRNLRKDYPDSIHILESSYHLEKLQPEAAEFWQLAQKRIEHNLTTQNYSDMLAIFQDIQKAAPNRQLASKHISPDYYLKILVIFIYHGDIEKAEHAFMFLELAGEPTLVKDACKLLIDTFSKKQNLKKQDHYRALLDNYL
tara:strand:- start:127 stop:1587 length:1461 start_codon:yes stop_codon:yes gene_type:complete